MLKTGIALGRDHDAGTVREAGEKRACLAQQFLGAAGPVGARHLGIDVGALLGRNRADLQERIDEEAQAHIGRHPPGARMRRIDESRFLKIHHDVANGSGRQSAGQDARNRARADGLAGIEIGLDQAAENLARTLVDQGETLTAVVEHGFGREGRHGQRM